MKHLSAVLLLSFGLRASSLGQAPGDLVVTPTRVRLDDKARSADITLVNRGTQPVRYRLSLVDMEMNEDGVLKRVSSIPNSATSLVRMSPREVLLEPGASQRIKVAAFFPVGSADGEFRSHLAFEPIAIPKPQTLQESRGFGINFEVRSVVTIPLIASHGRLTATAAIEDAHLTDGNTLAFRLTRSGARTVRGDITATFVGADGRKVLVGRASGMPVYFPNPGRNVQLRLDRDPRSLGIGELEIRFSEVDQRNGATARTVVKLQT